MDYFAKFKKRIVPPKAQPTAAMQLAKFHKCWDYVHVSVFSLRMLSSNAVSLVIRINPRLIDCILASFVEHLYCRRSQSKHARAANRDTQ